MMITGAAVLLVLVGAGCHSGPGTPYVFPEDSQVLVLAPTAPDALRIVPRETFEPNAAASVALDATPTGGLARTLSSMQGSPQYATATFTSAPLPQSVWLDLDQPVGGQLFIGNALSGARSVDSVRIITELYIDGAFAGGGYYEHDATSTVLAWNPVPVYFRPEAAVLPAGSVIEVRVSAQTGLADVKLGTGGAHQSRLEIAYYPFDPLSGAVFLEGGRLVSALSDGNATGNATGNGSLEAALAFMESPEFSKLPPGHYVVRGGRIQDAPEVGGLHPAMLLPLPLLLMGLVGRLPPRRLLAISLVAIMFFAGCAGPSEKLDQQEDPEAPKPRVDSQFEEADEKEAEGQRENQVGTIRGTVTNYFGIPVRGAHISILATNKFSTSDDKGAFEIRNVPAGKYTMRVDAQELESLERQIEVAVAKVTRLNIVLVPPSGTRADQIQHLHDEWRGQTRVLLDSLTADPTTYLYTQRVDGAGGRCAGPLWSQGSYGTNSASAPCAVPLGFDYAKRVLPGTSLVEIVLDWDASGTNIDAIGLQYSNALRPTPHLNAHLPRGPGEPFLLHVFPNQADPGHQLFSNWQFRLVAFGTSDGAVREGAYNMPRIEVSAYIHKGIVPFEPKHQDRWGDATSFKLADGTTSKAFSCICDPSNSPSMYYEEGGWISYTSAFWTPLKDSWIPAGTDRIEGRLIKNPYTTSGVTLVDPPHIQYSLGYKAADVPVAAAHGNLQIVQDIAPTSDGGFTFTIRPGEGEIDAWYQTSTQWRFYLLARSDVNTYWSSHGFKLEATAVKDPKWTFEE